MTPRSILFVSIVALLAVALMPLGMALAQEANPSRVLPDTVQGGETFDVTVNFTSPVDNFNAIGLTDLCPDGWDVILDKAWCTPNAEFVKATGNEAEFLWYGPYERGTAFSALYKVTVPDDAEMATYAFDGSVEYYTGSEGPYSENITGSSQVEVAGEGGTGESGTGGGVWWIVGIVVGIAVIVAAVLLVRRRRT